MINTDGNKMMILDENFDENAQCFTVQDVEYCRPAIKPHDFGLGCIVCAVILIYILVIIKICIWLDERNNFTFDESLAFFGIASLLGMGIFLL